MIIREAPLAGVWIVIPEPAADSRGLFARTFCEREFAAAGLPTRFVQCSTSFNLRRGTLRGLHWQSAPGEEGKLVRCTAGAAFDVAVDLRPGSTTRGRWFAIELDARTRSALFIPPGFAHGFQTLADETEIFYQMTEFFTPECSRGVRWDDPALAVSWPIAEPILSPRDAALPALRDLDR